MATNDQILTQIEILKGSTDEVLALARSNDRALRGHNSTIGIVARVKSIEDKNKLFYKAMGGVGMAILLDIANGWLNLF